LLSAVFLQRYLFIVYLLTKPEIVHYLDQMLSDCTIMMCGSPITAHLLYFGVCVNKLCIKYPLHSVV